MHIHTSHRTEALLGAFMRNVSEERQRLGPLAALHVVVPNPNVAAYVRLRMAEHTGIAANLEISFLRGFLTNLAEQAVPGSFVADAHHVEGQLLALLHDASVLAAPGFEAVRSYLTAAGPERDALDRRRCQLADLLSRLFDEYATSRPDLLERWMQGTEDGRTALAAWQKELWLAIFGPRGRFAEEAMRGGRRYLPLARLFAEATSTGLPPFAGKSLHVFGISYVSTTYRQMLAALAKHADVYLYTLNPCVEDYANHPSTLDSNSEDPFRFEEEENLALRLWARPGRENLRLFASLPGATLETSFPISSKEPLTLLHRLQDDIARRSTPDASTAHDKNDGSLRILPCPSVQRELEVVAAEIWQLMREDPSLRLCDIAVVVPETSKDLYLPQISSVFAASCGLPHNIADLPAASGHRATRAIELLLDLPFSSFTRKEFLPLLTHPCLLARFPGATPAHFSELAQELGIVRGADRTDFAGSYVTRDLFTWDQGLCRLALGALQGEAHDEDARPIFIHGKPILPGPSIAREEETSLGFGLLCRSLLADAHFATGHGSKQERPLAEWLRFVRGLVDGYVVLDEADNAGRSMVSRFFETLEELADNGLGQQPVCYRIAAELSRRALTSLPFSQGHYLASGVTVASFVPMRAIPFRAVFVVGLGQQSFPRPAGCHELDVRGMKRQVGDVDRHEQDLYMFLETLLSTRDYLTLSYVARDEITGDELPASSALLELRTLLGKGYCNQDELARRFCDEAMARPSLRRFDDLARRREFLPIAEGEHRAKALGRILISPGSEAASARERLAKLPPSVAAPMARLLHLPELPPNRARETSRRLVLSVSALRRFLEDPLQGSARLALVMREKNEDGFVDAEEEPFDLGRKDQSLLLRESMIRAMVAAQSVPSWENLHGLFEELSLTAELAGASPTGFLRSAAKHAEKSLLRAWYGHLHEVLGSSGAHCRTRHLHREEHSSPGREYLPAPYFQIVLPAASGGPGTSVEIILEGEAGFWATSKTTGDVALAFSCRRSIEKAPKGREELRAFLDYVVATACGAAPEQAGAKSALFYVAEGAGQLRTLGLAALARDRARAYLVRLLTDLLTGVCDEQGNPSGIHPYLLPYEAVFASQHKGSGLLDEIEAVCSLYESQGVGFSSVQGPVANVLAHYSPPTEATAQDMANQRFGLFFELAKDNRT